MKIDAFIKDILEKWSIQAFVMASLGFQMILVFLAPMRRCSKSGFMYVVIWSVYLLASFFATFALSLIYNSAPTWSSNKSDIFPFWAPFLLLHLGGPHTITALAMEDNNLWHRHMLTHIVQIFSVLVVFYQYKIFKSEWLFPTAIVFAVGIVKCVERTSSLHLASLTLMRRSIRKKIDKDSTDSGKQGSEDSRNWQGNGKKLDEYEVVREGYKYYGIFQGFIIDHTFIYNECGKGKNFFSDLGEEEAFKVVEMELYFMYQAMFTKMIAVQYWKNYFWSIWRFVCHALLVTVTVIFFCHSKHNVRRSDIDVTYCLLGGALVLDEIALAHLIFSEWTMAKIMNSDKPLPEEMKNRILRMICAGKKWITVNRYWSGRIIQYSLIDHSLNRRWKWAERTLDFLSLKESIDSCLHTTTVKVGHRLKKLVVEDIKRKEQHHQQATKTTTERSELRVLDEIILPAVEEHNPDYAMFVLILHVATEICYFTITDGEEGKDSDKELCKQISEYLAYLLALEGKITSVVPGSIGMRFKDICWEDVKHTLDDLDNTFYKYRRNKNAGIWCKKRTSRREACKYLMTEYIEEKPKEEDTEKSVSSKEKETKKSVLFKAVELARKLKNCCNNCSITQSVPDMIYSNASSDDDPDVENQTSQVGKNNSNTQEFWKSLSRVWVGLLLYASSHCRGDVYYLSRGGEFHTFVRLLKAHFGLGQRLRGERHFQPKEEIH